MQETITVENRKLAGKEIGGLTGRVRFDPEGKARVSREEADYLSHVPGFTVHAAAEPADKPLQEVAGPMGATGEAAPAPKAHAPKAQPRSAKHQGA